MNLKLDVYWGNLRRGTVVRALHYKAGGRSHHSRFIPKVMKDVKLVPFAPLLDV